MNRGQVRELFLSTLNNDECDETLADTFIAMGLRRIERVLRTPLQKTLNVYTVIEGYDGHYVLPDNYLAMDWIKVNGIRVYRYSGVKDDNESDSGSMTTWGNRKFYLENEKIYFRPDLAVGDALKFNYYSELPEGSEDNDFVSYGAVIPDLVNYSSLIFAGIHFTDDRLGTFRDMYRELLDEVQLQADLDEMSGGVTISNPYAGLI